FYLYAESMTAPRVIIPFSISTSDFGQALSIINTISPVRLPPSDDVAHDTEAARDRARQRNQNLPASEIARKLAVPMPERESLKASARSSVDMVIERHPDVIQLYRRLI